MPRGVPKNKPVTKRAPRKIKVTLPYVQPFELLSLRERCVNLVVHLRGTKVSTRDLINESNQLSAFISQGTLPDPTTTYTVPYDVAMYPAGSPDATFGNPEQPAATSDQPKSKFDEITM